MHEFNLIDKYFSWSNAPDDVVVSVGDDAAVLNVPQNRQLVTSIDTLISGVHFPIDVPAFTIGHKALAVNLSDIAAMGATPKWFTLALSLPEIKPEWLDGFSAGLKQLAKKHHCFLIGGDTTRGPLSISIQVMGLVESGHALLRSGANIGDKIYVTGTLGDAAAGLQTIQSKLILAKQDKNFCEQRLNCPTPRLLESQIIKAFATSCIDLSDGLLQDLSHLLKASKVAAQLELSKLPISNALKILDKKVARDFALSGGDDYELLFTIPAAFEEEFLNSGINDVVDTTRCIGEIINNKQHAESLIFDKQGRPLVSKGYNHFHAK